MLTTETATPVSPAKTRREALRPYQTQLAALLRQHGRRSGPLEIRIRSQRMTLTPWQKGALAGALADGGPPPAGVARIVADGLALQAKGLTDLDRYERRAARSPQERDAVLSDLLHDMALALAVTSEIRKAAETLKGEGRRGLASNLGQIGGSLLALSKQIEPRIGPEAVETARRLAPALAIDSEGTAAGSLEFAPAGGRAGRSAPLRGRFGSALRPEAGWKQVAVVLGLVLAAGTAALGLWLYLSAPTPVTMERAANYPGVVAVEGAPPAAVLTLDGRNWNSLDAGKRAALVFGVASILRHNGYREAEFRLPDGRRAARWREGRPIELAAGAAPH